MSQKLHSVRSDSLGSAATAGGAATANTAKRRTRVQPSGSSASTPDQRSKALSSDEAGIDRDAIARLAYSYWAARGYTGGSAEEDWLRAEQELRANQTATVVA